MNAVIVKILQVVDTRQVIEKEGMFSDTFVPVPGTGEAHTCDRCGRSHEIHATVLLSDGSKMTVGTGCMKQESPEVAKRFQAADRAAKRMRLLETELESRLAYRDLYEAARVAVISEGFPEITFTSRPSGRGGDAYMGDTRVAFHEKFDTERHECLKAAYIRRRLSERLPLHPRMGSVVSPISDFDVRKLRAEIEKVRARTQE